MPVANYSPELLQIFELGSQKEFIFDCGSAKRAHALRWRLHSLRREMRKELHPLTEIAEGVVISIRDGAIVAHPPDDSILPDLRKALAEQGADLLAKVELEEPEEYKGLPEEAPSKPFRHTKTPVSENAVANYLTGKKGK